MKFRTALFAAASALAMSSSALAADLTIRWGTVLAATHPTSEMIGRVAAAVAERTGGRIEIQAYPAAQLGTSRDMIEAVANGSQHMVTEGAGYFGAWVPKISVIEAPFVWRDPAHMMKTMNSDFVDQFNEPLVAQRGMRILGTQYYGTRHITTSNIEVKTPADMKGMKLRVSEHPLFQAMAEAWGATPTPLAFGELYLALSQGVVDGQENPLPTIYSAKLNEVQKNLVLSGHTITPMLVVVNEEVWQGMSEEDRTIFCEEVAAGIEWASQQILAEEGRLLDVLKSEGINVIEPDVAAFKQAIVDYVPPKFESQWGAGSYAAIQEME